jgi:hypothetical protein
MAVFQLKEQFEFTDSKLGAFMNNSTQLTETVIVQINRKNKDTTLAVFGADVEPLFFNWFEGAGFG